jgi:hypothetical protein
MKVRIDKEIKKAALPDSFFVGSKYSNIQDSADFL